MTLSISGKFIFQNIQNRFNNLNSIIINEKYINLVD